MSNQFYKLKVKALAKPINDASTITFDLPSQLNERFKYNPGQHLVIKFEINGKETRRSYSLNSSPFKDEALQVTVKRVKGGMVSNYVGDHLKVGDELEVMIPQGRFFAKINRDAYKTYFLFAAGSGITPIISILKSVLLASPKSMVKLFYGNTNQSSIIFKNELDDMQEQYPKRLEVVYTLSKPTVWSTWEQWKGRKGRIDTESVEWFISNHPPLAQNTEYFICGPGAMNISVRDTLIELGVPKELVHIEQFGGVIDDHKTTIDAFDNASITATINGKVHKVNIPKGQTILEALKDEKADPPYSCESGVCGTCAAKVTIGKAEMKACMALEEDEINKGMVLTCQALPLSEALNIEFVK